MRKPTSPQQSYAWHARALTGERLAMSENDPQCGYYLRWSGAKNRQDTKPPIPASIYLKPSVVDEGGLLTEPEEFVCEIGGKIVDISQHWIWLAKNPISREEYMRLVALKLTEI